MSRADSPLSGRMIFNVGSRRSGTFWLQRIVTAHPDVAAVPSETHLFSSGIAPLFDCFQHSLRSSAKVGEVYVEREAALDAVRDLCDVVFAGTVEPGAERIAERTPLHVFHLDLIAAVYPDARFVHIVRDGRDAARSVAAQEWGPESIEEAATEWRSAILAAREAGLSADVYREVRYEDLSREPSAVRGLYEWLGLPATDEIVAEAVSEAGIGANLGGAPTGISVGKWRDAYSAADLATFDRVAGDVLRELGYPPGDAAGPPAAPPPAPRPGAIARARARLAALRRPRLGRGGTPLRARKLQEIVDRVVGSLQEHSFDHLASLLTDDALIRVSSPRGNQQGRGERGRELLRTYLEGDSAFAGQQVRGDVFLGLPYAGVVLAYRGGAGEPVERTAFIRFAGERVGELIIYEL